jgi:IS605 OrfB family transposase
VRKSFRAYDLHHATYYAVRERFGLAAQLTVRVIKDVADAYKLDTKTKRTFRCMGSAIYDSRVLRWELDKSQVYIWTMQGRKRIAFVCGERQRQMLETLQGEADLVYRDGEYYLHQPCNIVEDDSFEPDAWLGVDIGLVNLATDSDGNQYSGAHILSLRKRRRRQRKRLQSKGTSSARRVLRRLSGKESRFASNENHRISKQIVELSKRTCRGIAIEDLKGIRDRVRLRRKQRDDLHSWSFYRLQIYISYKAKLHGVPVVQVDPHYTSQRCACCGHVAKTNRPTQDKFLCVACGFAGHADVNAAKNIGRAAVSPPYAPTDVDSYASRSGASSSDLSASN